MLKSIEEKGEKYDINKDIDLKKQIIPDSKD
jgi:hypothetical protein